MFLSTSLHWLGNSIYLFILSENGLTFTSLSFMFTFGGKRKVCPSCREALGVRSPRGALEEAAVSDGEQLIFAPLSLYIFDKPMISLT